MLIHLFVLFYPPFQLQRDSGLFLIFFLYYRHFSKVCAFVLWHSCAALAETRNWTVPSNCCQNHGECSAEHQHYVTYKSPKIPSQNKEGEQDCSEEMLYFHVYISTHLNCFVSSHTTQRMSNVYVTTRNIASTPNRLPFPTFVAGQLWRRFISHVVLKILSEHRHWDDATKKRL